MKDGENEGARKEWRVGERRRDGEREGGMERERERGMGGGRDGEGERYIGRER